MNPSVLSPPLLASPRIQPTSPGLPSSPTSGAQRRIAIAVDLSEESAYAVRWAVQNYLRTGDFVVLLHICPTSVLYGADWGSVQLQNSTKSNQSDQELQQKANTLAQPLVDGEIPFKIHIVKDRDMKERLCLEVERLGLSAVIMGSRGFGASTRRSGTKGRVGLGSVSYYCVSHCICPVVVVRYLDEDETGIGRAERVTKKKIVEEEVELLPVPEEEHEYHDAEEELHKS